MNINFNSADWKSLKEHVEMRRDDEVETLKGSHIDHELTQVIRGRIEAFEEILNLPSELEAI